MPATVEIEARRFTDSCQLPPYRRRDVEEAWRPLLWRHGASSTRRWRRGTGLPNKVNVVRPVVLMVFECARCPT
jgi:hypothetical protein